jgi:hypothetical protein
MALGKTVYGMTPEEREKQIEGVRKAPYYDTRDREDSEVILPIDAQEIDLLGRALTSLHHRMDQANTIASLLVGVEVASAETAKVETLHYRLAKARFLLTGKDDPDEAWPTDQEDGTAEAAASPASEVEEVPSPDPVSPTAEELEAGALDR